MRIWLDDFRQPPSDGPWLWAKSVIEAQSLVWRYGFPEFVAFDHDLPGPGSKTGCDFAHWLIQLDQKYGMMPANFDFSVHSANPDGAENIGRLMANYLKHKKQQ